MPIGRTLLLADDSPTVQKVVSLTFGDEGLRVLTVGSGSEALAQLEREAPDVLLADVHMPAPGGYELCARVKRDERLRHVPVLLLVGAFEPFDEAEARECGADGVLTKPFQSIRDLVNKVGGLLGGHAEPKRSEEDERHAAESSAEPHADDARGSRHAAAPVAGASAETAPPARPDLDLDDESIETVSAESFAARAHEAAAQTRGEVRDVEASAFSRDADAAAFEYDAEAPAFAREEVPAATAAPSPFVIGDPAAQQQPDARVFAADDARVFAADESRGLAAEDSRSFAGEDSRSFAAAASGFHPPAPPAAFDSRAASASAEDSLLDLDDIIPAPDAGSDDFILDFEEDSASAPPAAFDAGPHAAQAPPRSEQASAHFEDSASRAEDAARFEEAAQFGEATGFGEAAARSEAATAHGEESPAEISPANLSSAWKEPELFEVSEQADAHAPAVEPLAAFGAEDASGESAPLSFEAAPDFQVAPDVDAEPAVADAPDVKAEPAVEAAHGFGAATDVEAATDFEVAAGFPAATDVAAAPLQNVESVAAAATLVSTAAPAEVEEQDAHAGAAEESPLGAVAETASSAPHESSQAGGAQLSQEMIDAIARRVVEQMSERVLREIAWDVVPDLAERLIRQRLEEDKAK